MDYLVAGRGETASAGRAIRRRVRDVRQINWVLRIGYIEKRRSVHLVGEIQPVDRAARMMGHVGNVTVALMHDDWLVSRASIQTVVPEQLGVPFGLRRS